MDDNNSKYGLETQLNRLGRDSDKQAGFVNCPVYRGSTVVYKSNADREKRRAPFVYGTAGNPTIQNLIDAWTHITHAAGSVILPSGLGAVTLAILTAVKTGDHVLVADCVYGPTRKFCDDYLAKIGITATYYDPLITEDGLRETVMHHPNTSLVFMESPGSLTFEVQNVSGLAKVCKDLGICSVVDNTWATPVFFDALGKGCDMSVEAGTKYLGGHSDLLLGLVAANAKWYPKLRETFNYFAMCPGNEDCFLALRGLRTLHLRLKEAERRGLEMATWLSHREEVEEVRHPALPSSPGHNIWKRDYTGSSGLLSFVLRPKYARSQLDKFMDGMEVFTIGSSWGGFESLITAHNCAPLRTAVPFSLKGILIRLQIGLEDLDDLKRDLSNGFDRMKD